MTLGLLPKWANLPVRVLILETEDFIVFLDDDHEVDWKTSTEWDRQGPQDASKHNAILNEYALLEATPCEGLRPAVVRHYRRLIGEAVARSLKHDYRNATQALVSARTYLAARQEEASRAWYLAASAGMTAPVLLVAIVAWIWRNELIASVGPTFLRLLLAATAGSLGALLSVISRMGKLSVGCAAGPRVHVLEGVSRIWAGALSGVLAALAFRAELILGYLSRSPHQFTAMLLVSLAAGISERWIPTILSHLEQAGATRHQPRASEEAT